MPLSWRCWRALSANHATGRSRIKACLAHPCWGSPRGRGAAQPTARPGSESEGKRPRVPGGMPQGRERAPGRRETAARSRARSGQKACGCGKGRQRRSRGTGGGGILGQAGGGSPCDRSTGSRGGPAQTLPRATRRLGIDGRRGSGGDDRILPGARTETVRPRERPGRGRPRSWSPTRRRILAGANKTDGDDVQAFQELLAAHELSAKPSDEPLLDALVKRSSTALILNGPVPVVGVAFARPAAAWSQPIATVCVSGTRVPRRGGKTCAPVPPRSVRSSQNWPSGLLPPAVPTTACGQNSDKRRD